MFVLLTAALTWSSFGATLWIGYPSDGIVERVCVDSTCFEPKHRQQEVIEWRTAVSFVSALVRLPDGTTRLDISYRIDGEGT